MTTIDALLDELRQRGVTLWMEGDRLRYRAAKDALSPDLLAQLKEHKPEIIIFLRQASASAGTQLLPIIAVDRKGVLPLSFAQQRLWFLHQFEPDSTSNNMPVVVRFVGSLNVEALEKSIQEVVRRHEVLRTTFPAVDGQPTLAIAEQVDISLSIFDLRTVVESQRQEEALQLATKEARQPFDLANGPILRVKLIQLQDDESLLIWNAHCIVCDGASSDVFYQDLTAVYKAFANGEPSPLPALPIQYADFAHWQRQWLQGDVLEAQLNYWKQKLNGDLPVIQLPFDHPRPVGVQTYNGDRCALMLPKSLNEALTRLSQRLGATLFMTLLAAFETLLCRYSGQEDMLISFASAGRGQVETEGLVGFFSNTLMLRTNFEGNLTFRELLNQVKETSLEAYTYQDIPFEKLVEELRPEQSQMRSPLFQVKFALNPPWSEGRGMASVELPDLTITSLFGYIYHGKTKYDLTLVMREQDEGLGMVFDYNADIFDKGTIARLLAHFQRLLESIVANPDQQIAEMPLLTADEQYRQLDQWNSIHSTPVADACVHQLFEAQVEQTPDAVAIVFADQQLTYQVLNSRANQLAHYLQTLGVGAETLVGICMEPSPETIVGILGVLKAGGAYVPLVPDDSQKRLTCILDQIQAPVLLTQKRLVEKLSPQSAAIVCLDADWDIIQQESSENSVSKLTSDNLACVLYETDSDFTQGVSISHRGLTHLGKESNLADLTPQDVFLHHTPLSSAPSAFEIWSCLLHGPRLVIPSSYSLSPKELGQTVQDYQVTVLWLTTRLFHRLVDRHLENFESVRQLLTGGDTLSSSHVQKLLQTLKHCQLTNVYSLAENTTLACYYPISELPQTSISIPIGRHVANTQIYLLDQHRQPVPIGVPGELYLSGSRLAQGYFNNPSLTAEKFLPNPFVAESGTSLYKTGDLARYLPDGNIESLGRIDSQLKIRGLRTELSRIETVLGQHSAVREVAVLVREDLPGDRCLVAYVVPNQEGAIATSDLQSFLKQKFPAYMLPSAFVVLDSELPLDFNGNVDSCKLPAPDLSNQTSEAAFAAPQNEVELQLTEIWEKVLGIQPVGIRDNFFDLGGHSLLAVQLFAQIEETFHKKLPLSTLLQQPTVEQLATVIQPSNLPSEQPNPRESLVLLRGGGSGQPFFFIHDGDGEIVLYLNLANRLKPEHPVYGIQPLSQEGFPILHSRIEEMAAYYIEKIRTVQPEGPYLLGGLCAGGVLSFEVARQLQTQGQRVALVAILDAADVQAPQRIGQVAKQRLSRFSQALNQSRTTEKQERSSDRFSVMVKKIRNVLTYEVETKFLNAYNRLKVKLYQSYLDRKLPVPQFLQNISVRTIYTLAKEGYIPQVYQGKVILFRAADTDDSESVVSLVSDPLFGWSQRTTDGVTVYDVPGGHSSMLQVPHVEVLAQEMQTCISEALSQEISGLEQNRELLNSSKTNLKSIQVSVVPR